MKNNLLATKKCRKGVSLYEVIDWFNLANVNNIIITFIINFSRVFYVKTCLCHDSR